MISTYSTRENAISAVPAFCSVKEQDVFVMNIKCPYGEEFSLRTRDQILNEESENISYKYYLPFEHCFINSDNAKREAGIWSQRLGKEITLDRHYKFKKGYKIFSHYTLKA